MKSELVAAYAAEMIDLWDAASLAPPISSRTGDFTSEDAYQIAAAVMKQRESAGWRRVGRKIGFTNRTIYAQYGVYAPMFGYMYDRTVAEARGNRASVSLAGLAQPLIEPEIVFKLKERPAPSADAATLLRSVEWLAHGLEIVQCHFPDWKFSAADTIADGGLHGRYVLGAPARISAGDVDALVGELAGFRVELRKDGAAVAEGGGELVLGSPLNALRHLSEVLEGLPEHPRLEAGEIITTGTLTTALPVTAGEVWSTRIEGLALPGLELRFES